MELKDIIQIVANILVAILPLLLGHMKFKEWLTAEVMKVDAKYFGEGSETKFEALVAIITKYVMRVKNRYLQAVLLFLLTNRKVLQFYVSLILGKMRPATEAAKITKANIMLNTATHILNAATENVAKDVPVELLKESVDLIPKDVLKSTIDDMHLNINDTLDRDSYIKAFARYNTNEKFTVGAEYRKEL